MAQQENTRPLEVWMRGPVEGIPALLQPVAHALLQAAEELEWMMSDFTDDHLWEKPGGMASVGFHLQHIPGVLDRLFTYARNEQLTSEQLKYLSEEGLENEQIKAADLTSIAINQIHKSVEQLKQINPDTLTHVRSVGRKKIPSTVIGLIFHSAEHTMRHTGQLLVTRRIVSLQEG